MHLVLVIVEGPIVVLAQVTGQTQQIEYPQPPLDASKSFPSSDSDLAIELVAAELDLQSPVALALDADDLEVVSREAWNARDVGTKQVVP